MDIKVREYEQMMLGGYIYLVPVKLFIQFVIQPAFQFCSQFRLNIYLCKTQIQNLHFKYIVQNNHIFIKMSTRGRKTVQQEISKKTPKIAKVAIEHSS